MAANNAAAQSHSGPTITNVKFERTFESTVGQMVFEISSKGQSLELLIFHESEKSMDETID